MTLVYANIASLSAISWQLLKKVFIVLKKHFFLRLKGLKGLKMVLKKSSLIWKLFPWFWLKTPFSPDFPDWKKSSKFSLNSLIGGNPVNSMSLVQFQHLCQTFLHLNIYACLPNKSPVCKTSWYLLIASRMSIFIDIFHLLYDSKI